MQDKLELLHDRYARALFEYAREENCIGKVMEELEVLNLEWLESEEFDKLLTHPLISADEKKSAIALLAREKKFCAATTDFLNVLIDNGRENLIHAVFLRYRDLYDESKKQARVYVETPELLEKEDKIFLIDELTRKFGKKINVEIRKKPDLISGLSVRYKDRLYDYSAKGQLERLGEILTKGERD